MTSACLTLIGEFCVRLDLTLYLYPNVFVVQCSLNVFSVLRKNAQRGEVHMEEGVH